MSQGEPILSRIEVLLEDVGAATDKVRRVPYPLVRENLFIATESYTAALLVTKLYYEDLGKEPFHANSSA